MPGSTYSSFNANVKLSSSNTNLDSLGNIDASLCRNVAVVGLLLFGHGLGGSSCACSCCCCCCCCIGDEDDGEDEDDDDVVSSNSTDVCDIPPAASRADAKNKTVTLTTPIATNLKLRLCGSSASGYSCCCFCVSV